MTTDNVQLEDYSFGKLLHEYKFKGYLQNMDEYQTKLEKILDGTLKMPIFLDTNFLTKYYKLSVNSRQIFVKYIKANQKNIFLTARVQKEFIKNREGVIVKFNKDLKAFSTGFGTNVVNQISVYHNNIKKHLDDFVGVEEMLTTLTESAKELQKVINKKADEIADSIKNIKNNDEFFELLTETNLLNPLNKEEVDMLTAQFNFFKTELAKDRAERIAEIHTEIFPGSKDISEKPVFPYGDYIIFHEILKFIKENKRDVIFLTYDDKNDWLDVKGNAYSLYLQMVKNATGYNMFILNADRYFDTLNIQLIELVDEKKVQNELTGTEVKLGDITLKSLGFKHWLIEQEYIKIHESLVNLYREYISGGVPGKYQIPVLEKIVTQLISHGILDSEFELDFHFVKHVRNIAANGDEKIEDSFKLYIVTCKELGNDIELALSKIVSHRND